MLDALNSLRQAHQQLKDHAIASLQNDQDIEDHVLIAIKSVYALIQELNQQELAKVTPI